MQRDCAATLSAHFTSDGLVNRCLEYAMDLEHVMDFTRLRALNSLFSMLNQAARNILSYNAGHPDFPMAVSGAVLMLYRPSFFSLCFVPLQKLQKFIVLMMIHISCLT